jgi:hypothetical protein
MLSRARNWIASPAVLLAAISLVCAAPAGAAPLDARSDHVALRAWRSYLSGIESAIPSARRADDAFVATLSRSCPNVLAPLNFLALTPTNRAVFTALGEEVGGNLTPVAVVPKRPLASMTRTLSRLRWSRRQTGQTIQRYLAAAKEFSQLSPSDLCADAGAMAASNASTTPPATLNWLAMYARDENATVKGTSAFMAVLTGYAGSGEGAVIKSVHNLAIRANSDLVKLIRAEAFKALAALGLST